MNETNEMLSMERIYLWVCVFVTARVCVEHERERAKDWCCWESNLPTKCAEIQEKPLSVALQDVLAYLNFLTAFTTYNVRTSKHTYNLCQTVLLFGCVFVRMNSIHYGPYRYLIYSVHMPWWNTVYVCSRKKNRAQNWKTHRCKEIAKKNVLNG